MYQRLRDYTARIEALLEAGDASTDWEAVLAEHLDQIAFFQHERLVHLLVTLAFALMELGATACCLLTHELAALALMLLFLVLLVPYIVHYYHLENGTQALYGHYDRLRERLSRR
jgi:hypothetical protein